MAVFQICSCHKIADTRNEPGVETLGSGTIVLVLSHHLNISLDSPFLAAFRGKTPAPRQLCNRWEGDAQKTYRSVRSLQQPVCLTYAVILWLQVSFECKQKTNLIILSEGENGHFCFQQTNVNPQGLKRKTRTSFFYSWKNLCEGFLGTWMDSILLCLWFLAFVYELGFSAMWTFYR